MKTPLLRAIQGGLEAMYRVSTELDVDDFLVDEPERDALGPARSPGEQLFVRQDGSDMAVGLFVNRGALQRLERNDPRLRLDDDNLPDFMMALEGVSHFVYLALRAQAERTVSAVELELQAEVDKFAVALLVCWDQNGDPPEGLRARLFEHMHLVPDLGSEERERYQLANAAANDYAASLEARYVRRRAIPELLEELRRFYQQGLAGKLDRIARAA